MKYVLDWNEYQKIAREAVTEGLVLVENKNHALPFTQGMEIAVFGRIQAHYYKSGTGSGGMVNVSHVSDILEGLRESNVVTLNEELLGIYQEWEKTHPFNKGLGWGMEPWSQEEMPVTDEIAKKAATTSDAALVIIGRTAGEDKDSTNTKGSFQLTDIETDMLSKVRKHFSRMVVLLNVGGIIDMHFVDEIKPDAVLYGWQGGMIGGLGTADVLTGKVSPSGKLPDTVAFETEDYLSNENFGDSNRNYYCEDIYVGYRYFETFAPDKVRYPFGYGLSYTDFSMQCEQFSCDVENHKVCVDVTVTNTGEYPGKQVIQIYAGAPQGALGKPAKVLIAFEKTKTLQPKEQQTLHLEADFAAFASYDDSGVTGHPFCFLLEDGCYHFYLGDDVRHTNLIDKVQLSKTIIEQLSQALAPVLPFERIRPDKNMHLSRENVPLAKQTQTEKSLSDLPAEIPYTGRKGITLADVLKAENDADTKSSSKKGALSPLLSDFIAQLSDEELASIIRGEGMGSSLVTPGTASAFGGVSKALRDLGLPAVCCDDGPSGMRLDSGAKAFSLPNGTLLGATFNRELNEQLFTFLALEMISNKVECLLGPGMNIHRHPLNGRNFEYFSEDPLLTGEIASAQLKGLKRYGVSGTAKHFCGNNQELRRHYTDSVISERALREIYLKGFEIAVKSGFCDSIMTTYGKVNGHYTAGSYDLTTTILRKEWGFRGVAMSDWWAAITELPDGKEGKTDFAVMARCQNDLYMVCPDGETNASGDNTLEALTAGAITRGELQRNAMNICDFVMHTEAMKRQMGAATEVEVTGRPKDADDFDISDVEYRILDKELTISLEDKVSEMGTSYVLAFDIKTPGTYRITLRGSSELSELAQMTCTLFYNGFPVNTMTFHGTGGNLDSIFREVIIRQRFSVMRLYVGADGLKLKDIQFELIEEGSF